MNQRPEYFTEGLQKELLFICIFTKEDSDSLDELTIFITVFDALLGLSSQTTGK